MINDFTKWDVDTVVRLEILNGAGDVVNNNYKKL